MNMESPPPPFAAASSSLSCETCGKSDTLEVARTRLAQHVTCRECGAEHVFALRQQWTLIHPSGTVLSFDSMTALRRALDDGDDGDDDAINLVSISEPPRIAPIPPVPDASSPLPPPPPPPPHRTSAAPTMPVPPDADADANANASSATIALPKPSPLPPPSEPMMAARIDTIQGLGEAPDPEQAISLRNAIERGGEDDLADDAHAGPASDEAPRSEEAFPLARSATSSKAPSEPDVGPISTSTSSPALEETVRRRRWTDLDQEALALPPPPRRGGWVVAAGLVAAAAGLVVYLHDASSKPAGDRSTSMATAAATSAATTAAPTNDEPAPLPSTLVAVPAEVPAAPGTSLLPPATTPVSITTTTNATTPLAAGTAAAEPASEDLLPMSELLRRAHGSLREGDRRRAEQRFRLALAKDPANVEALAGLGDIARAEGDLDTARERYQRALERSPSFVPALLALADLEWDLGRRTDAQKKYTSIVERLGDRAPTRAKERKGEDAPSP